MVHFIEEVGDRIGDAVRPVADAVELLTAPLVVQASEILKVEAATPNRLHVVASYLEIT